MRELDPNDDQQASILEMILQTGEVGIPFPDGAKAFDNGDGSITIKLPDGYKYIVIQGNDEAISEIGEASVTCSCTSGSGCSPVKAKGEYYCVMGSGCTSCSKSVSSAKLSVNILGMYDSEGFISFISKTEKVDGLEAIGYTKKGDTHGNFIPQMLELSKIKKSLFDLYNFIYSGKIPKFILENSSKIPKGYSYVRVNIYGTEAAIPIPSSFVDKIMLPLVNDQEVIGEIGTVSCTCNKGSGCKLGSMLGVKYCEAGKCSSCTLNDN